MQQIIEKVEKEVLEKVVEVRKEKKVVAAKVAKEKSEYNYKVNDRVRVVGSNAIGTIEKIEKKKVEINYGFFTTKTTVDKLEFVDKSKK